eukprot:TRINITY_DN17_c0_g1_i2.p1 TRINITY_DN17_c0_g1~~TRINITY_DN17_c0_g1_i2.p1  ORF type:complete len:282 (+),score=62.27 TRINITY_DN17_c0_g1_i2:74-919(+)
MSEMSFQIHPGDHVAFLCGNPNYEPNRLLITQIKTAVQQGSLVVGTQQDSNLGSVSNSSLDIVISQSPSPTDHTLNLFFEIFRVLRGDGAFICYEPIENRTFEISENLTRNLTVAGFVTPVIKSQGSLIEISCKKPEWETGTSQSIKIKKKPVKAKAAPVNWDVNMDDAGADLMDESDLLDEKDKIKPNMDQIMADCGAGKTGGKACKNCTCGRAELEANGGEAPKRKLTLDMIENPGVDSSCGSCALGDAFRCAGCPYRGLPAFKPGEKITLPDDFFVDT